MNEISNKNKRQFIFIRETYPHMGLHSGYDLLFKNIERIIGNQYSIWFSKKKDSYIIDKLLNKISFKYIKTKTPFYSKFGLRSEIKAIAKCFFKKKQISIIHISNIEDCYGLLTNKGIKSLIRPVKIIGTTHQPASWWRLNCRPNIVSNLDALIVLSEVEKNFFEPYLPNKVFVIPHGVDHFFFTPDPSKKKEFRCIFSGQWLRDMDMLFDLIEKAISIRPNLKFDIIYPSNVRDNPRIFRIARYKQVHWYSNVTDLELRDLYQKASILIMPLLDCTANNALLEAMSSGLPVITNNIAALKTYLPNEDCYIFENLDINRMVEKVVQLYDSNTNHSSKIRFHVEKKLTWNLITNKYLEVYNQISDNKLI